jgi:hypothetical protein
MTRGPFLSAAVKAAGAAQPTPWWAGSHADAATLIVGGYEGIKAREGKMAAASKARVLDAAGQLVRLYEAWGKPAKARSWAERVGLADLPIGVFAKRPLSSWVRCLVAVPRHASRAALG